MAGARIVKWVNSLAGRIPKTIAEAAGVREGDPVTLEAAERKIKVRRRRKPVPTLRELVAQIKDENRYDEIQTGPALGKETVGW